MSPSFVIEYFVFVVCTHHALCQMLVLVNREMSDLMTSLPQMLAAIKY